MMPPSMMAISAASIRRSTVHHHAAKGVRCARETMLSSSGLAWAFILDDLGRGLQGLKFWPARSISRLGGGQSANGPMQSTFLASLDAFIRCLGAACATGGSRRGRGCALQ